MGKGKIRAVISGCIILALIFVVFTGCTKRNSDKAQGITAIESESEACEPEGGETDDVSRTEQNNITEPDSISGQKQTDAKKETSAQKQTDAKKETSAQKQTDAQKQTGAKKETDA